MALRGDLRGRAVHRDDVDGIAPQERDAIALRAEVIRRTRRPDRALRLSVVSEAVSSDHPVRRSPCPGRKRKSSATSALRGAVPVVGLRLETEEERWRPEAPPRRTAVPRST